LRDKEVRHTGHRPFCLYKQCYIMSAVTANCALNFAS
jgi:hypothetical protein